MAVLKRLNHLDNDLIRVGQKLRLPKGATPSRPEPEPMPEPEPEPEPQPEPDPALTGDDTSSADDDTADDSGNTQVDETDDGSTRDTAGSSTTGFDVKPYPYKVGEGETLDDIARSFVVTKREIMELNNITDPDSIRPGQIIQIPPTEL